MPAITVEGIILKRSNFGEADRMLTILTKNYGKISVVARGVRKITSRRAGNVELLNIVKVGLFKGKGYTLTEAQSVKTFPRIKSNLAVSTAGFHIIELIDKILPENDPNPNVYDLVRETLLQFENNPRQIILRGFEIKLLKLTGFWSLNKIKISDQNLVSLIKKLEIASIEEIAQMKMNYPSESSSVNRSSPQQTAEDSGSRIEKDEAIALEKILRYYLESVLEGKLKSADVMRDLRK